VEKLSIQKIANSGNGVYLEAMTIPDLKLIGNRIREARKDSGLTQLEIGKHLDLTQGMINKIETGQNAITLANLFKLAEVLNRPLAYFLGIDVGDLTAEEGELVGIYRSIPEGPFRQYGKKMLRSWADQILEKE
jgi:transcriptional regulator with XRE-family HTH domain